VKPAAKVRGFFGKNDDSWRMTGKLEVIDSSVGLVPRNALVLTGLTNFQVVGKQEGICLVCKRESAFFAPAKLRWLGGYPFAFEQGFY
jgi:hypothetical protein